MSRLAIMQPYFVPYLGYFQIINCVDRFVVYDDVNFIKGGWINRNRILLNGAPHYITIPLSKASPNKRISHIMISTVGHWRKKVRRTIESAYIRAPHYETVFPLFDRILANECVNLVEFLLESLKQVCSALQISTPFLRSSELNIGVDLHGADRVLSICEALGAEEYVNSIGGVALYSSEQFRKRGIALKFLKCDEVQYPQYENRHAGDLSIIDVMMFNGRDRSREYLSRFTFR